LCAFAMSAKPSEKAVSKDGPPSCSTKQHQESADVLTVFLTGNELGELKPCGCSGGQLGGLDRRAAIFNGVPALKRMIISTGSFVKSNGDQDQIKFDIMIQAHDLLGYDLLNLTERDIEIARNLGLLAGLHNVISSHKPADVNIPAKFTKQLSLKKAVVAVTVAALDTESGKIEHVRELFDSPRGVQTVNILIVNHCDERIVGPIAEMAIVDCLVCPAESDEAMVSDYLNKRPLVVSVGRFGRYVGRLQISAAEGEDRLKLSFLPVPLTEDLPREKSLVELYKTYQQIVKMENLLEKQPRFILPDGLEYAGSESCKACHEYAYEKWSTKAHARAYATLEKEGTQYDPECIVCHVVGYTYQSGFVSEDKTGHLKNVGCENCHGPGSKHNQYPLLEKTTEPKSKCTDCHTPEHSANYAGNEKSYLEKIVHWREPKAASNVK